MRLAQSMHWFSYNCMPRNDKGWKPTRSVEGQKKVLEHMLSKSPGFIATQEAGIVHWYKPGDDYNDKAKFNAKHKNPRRRFVMETYPKTPMDLGEYKDTIEGSAKWDSYKWSHWGSSILYNSKRWEKIYSRIAASREEKELEEMFCTYSIMCGAYKGKNEGEEEECVLVVNVHLDHWDGKAHHYTKIRNSIAGYVERVIGKLDGEVTLVIIMGDMNEFGWKKHKREGTPGVTQDFDCKLLREDGVFDKFCSYNFWSKDGPEYSLYHNYPDRSFFGTNKGRFKLESKVRMEEWHHQEKASDHHPRWSKMTRKIHH